jgi:hypothetical protein
MDRVTKFSPCRRYRYTLWREWDDLFAARREDYLMVIGLNPSTADETQDDPTIRRCIDFAKRWGFGALCMTNLFAWRDTKPERMRVAPEPIGPMNDQWLSRCAVGAGMILAAWGNHGSFKARGDQVTHRLSMIGAQVHCLGTNADGSPKHPLYIKGKTVPLPYELEALAGV